MISGKLHLEDYFPYISVEFCHFQAAGMHAVVSQLRSKIKYLEQSLLLKQEEIQVSIAFTDLVSIPKVDSDNLIRFVRGQEGLLCRLHLSGERLPEETLLHLQNLVDAAFLSALRAHLKPGGKQAPFALSSLFASQRPRPSLTKVLEPGSVSFQACSSPDLSLSLAELRGFELTLAPHGLLLDYDNYNHPEFQTWKHILSLLSKPMISLIAYHLGKDGLKYLCQTLEAIPLAQLSELMSIFFSGADETKFFLLALPSGQKYLEAWFSWPPEIRLCFLAWVKAAERPLDFFQAMARMQTFWQDIKGFCPLPSPPTTTFRDLNFFSHLDTLSALIQLVAEPYRQVQVNLLFNLNARPLAIYTKRKHETEARWFCESMFNSPQVVLQELDKVLIEPSEASFFQYASQFLQDYRFEFYQLFAYAAAITKLTPEHQAFAWSLAAWVSASFELMKLSDFLQIYQRLKELDERDSLLVQLFSIPPAYRPNAKQFKGLVDLAQDQPLRLKQILVFYASWHQNLPRAFSQAWPLLLNWLQVCPREQLDLILQAHWHQPFSLVYARSLLLAFGLRSSDLEQLLPVFTLLSLGQQVEFLAILVSMQGPWQPIPANELYLILQDTHAQKGHFFDLFMQYLPQIHFHYFASMVDYDLVLERMSRLLNSVKLSLRFFLGDESFMLFVPKVRSLLKKQAIAELETQQAHLVLVEAELKSLRDLRQELDLSHLFTLFKQFDHFFVAFVEHRLEDIFEPLLFSFLGRLDANLKKTNRLKQLMNMVLAKYDKIATTRLGQHLKPEMLKILVEDTPIPLMQRFLQQFLVDDLIQALAVDLDLKLAASQVPTLLRQQLSLFLHHLPLDVRALNHFFLRYQGILKVIQEWPQLEKALLALNLHPELAIDTWKLGLETQFVDGDVYFSGHWHLMLALLKRLIPILERQPQVKFPLVSLLQSFFKARDAIAQFKVLGDGSLAHPHSELMWTSLEDALSQYGPQSLWLNLLPQALTTILDQGQAFNFAKSLAIFASLDSHPAILLQLLNLEDQAQAVQVFLDDIRQISALPPNHRSILDKLLRGFDPNAQLSRFHTVLVWLLAEKDFPWLDIILDDPDFCFSDIDACQQALQGESVWAEAYHSLTKPKLMSPRTWIEPEPEPVLDSKPWWRAWTWKAKTDLPLRPEQAIIHPDFLMAQEAWKTFSQAPYPRFVQLQTWLAQTPSQSQSAIENFDAYPLTRIEPYAFQQADFVRWLEELKVYVGGSLDKSQLEWSLKNLFALINRHLLASRRHLVEQFHAMLMTLRQPVRDQDCIHQLLAIIAALYSKSTGRRPYPTQVLTIMVYLAFAPKNLILEVDTGEGKGITTALLAVVKWALAENSVIEILTANRDLVKQDYEVKGHWRFFQLLGIPHRIIEENSAVDAYPEQGIIYTTQDDIAVFKELQRLNRGHIPYRRVEAIVDEVDHHVLDQNMVINLAIRPANPLDWTELYVLINQFVDRHWQEKELRTWAGWVENLKSAALVYYRGNHFRQAKLNRFGPEKWRLWLELAVYAKDLRENQDFIVEAVELPSGQCIYQALPYFNSDIKYGYELSYKSQAGLKQFLHARLNSAQRPFVQEPEPSLVAQISPNYLAQVHSFVGLTGSLGSISECRELKESLFANLVRIPRYFPSRLQEGQALILADLCSGLQQILTQEEHPVLICLPDIEAAQHLYQALLPLFLDRPLGLLTGQEPQWTRQGWLQRKAGHPGAITIATLICGRGTDIAVASPYFLKILQLGILEPRHTMQLKGRTARNNHPGYYQLLLDGQSLRLIGKTSPIKHLVDARQHEMILSSRTQRLMLRMKTWLGRYIFEILAANLSQMQVPQDIQNDLYLSTSAALADLNVADTFNPKAYFEPAKQILQTLMAKLVLLGQIKSEDNEERLLDSLNADKERWASIIPPVFSPLALPPLFQTSDFQLNGQDFLLIQTYIQTQVQMKKLRTWFGWLYRPPVLEQLSLKLIQESWLLFTQLPQAETWEIFYSSLVSAQILYQTLVKNRMFAKSYSILLPWVKLLEQIQRVLEKHRVLEQEEAGFFRYLASQVEKYRLFSLPNSWSVWLMKIFQASFYQSLTQVQAALETFVKTPQAHHLAHLQEQVQGLAKCHAEASNSWWRGWWYRWLCPDFCQAYLELDQLIPNLISQYAHGAKSYQTWLDLEHSLAHHQLSYRQGILQEQLPKLSRFSFLTTSKQLHPRWVLRAEMDELGRLFPREIYALYAKFYQLSSQDLSQQPRTWVLLAVLRAYFNPINPKLSLDLMTEEFRLVLREFDRWSNSRELLIEWEQMNPSLA